VWGSIESDGVYDMCCMEYDVPMRVGIDGSMLFMRGMLWVFFLCGGDLIRSMRIFLVIYA
jgi:hypothetical protein